MDHPVHRERSNADDAEEGRDYTDPRLKQESENHASDNHGRDHPQKNTGLDHGCALRLLEQESQPKTGE